MLKEPTLTLAIPTYNRSERLARCLSDILVAVTESKYKDSIHVLVSNNGSPDSTARVASSAQLAFDANSLSLEVINRHQNDGFSANLATCLMSAKTDYVLMFSDDDNLMPGALDIVYSCIRDHTPSVAIFEFNQADRQTSPLLNHEPILNLGKGAISPLADFIGFPKLSRVIFGKGYADGRTLESLLDSEYFPHVFAALEVGWNEGRVLTCSFPIGFPDSDFMDHIDFVPYVGNLYKQDLAKWAKSKYLSDSETESLVRLSGNDVDVMRASLLFLWEHERGIRVFPERTKRLLEATVFCALRGQRRNAEGLKLYWSSKTMILMLLWASYKIKNCVKSGLRCR